MAPGREPDGIKPMAREVELKLELPAGAVIRVRELPWLRKLTCGRVQQQRLVSVYFDTPRQTLRGHGLSLRVRHAEDKRIQTIKAENEGARGGVGRDEWEHEITSDRPDLTRAKGTALAKLATKKLKRKLCPVFETVIERTAIPVRCKGAHLELAIDRGLIRGSGHRQAVNEIEIELKDGDQVAVAELAERLARALPVT